VTSPPPPRSQVRIAGHRGTVTFLGMQSATVAHLWSATGHPDGNRFVPLADLVPAAPSHKRVGVAP
jgi:hypothetical protein